MNFRDFLETVQKAKWEPTTIDHVDTYYAGDKLFVVRINMGKIYTYTVIESEMLDTAVKIVMHECNFALNREHDTTKLVGAQWSIAQMCERLKQLLLQKNRKYGNSALDPIRVFSKASNIDQLLVRIDDKLNRIRNRQNDEDEDPIFDLAGYLILLMVAKEHHKQECTAHCVGAVQSVK